MPDIDESQTEFDKIFTEWYFNDKAGNRIRVVPWSLLKSKSTLKIVGNLYAGIKEHVPDLSLTTFFFKHTHVFFQEHFDKVADLICLTVDKPTEWLDQIDIAMGLELLEVIWRQNFTGDRVQAQVAKWFVMVPAESAESLDSLDLILPGNI